MKLSRFLAKKRRHLGDALPWYYGLTYYDVSLRGDVHHIIPLNFLIRAFLVLQTWWYEVVVYNDARLMTRAGWSDAFDHGYEAGKADAELREEGKSEAQEWWTQAELDKAYERGWHAALDRLEAMTHEKRPQDYASDWAAPVTKSDG